MINMSSLQHLNDPSMLDGPDVAHLNLIDERLKKRKSLLVQFSGTDKYTEELLTKLDAYCQKYGDRLQVRFYGHYSQKFDFNVLKSIPHVENLIVDISSTAKNIYTLCELRHLKKLGFGFYQLKEVDIFQSENITKLSELRLFETKTKSVDLDFLRKCKELTLLSVHGHRKNADAIGELSKLKTLAFRSAPDFSLAFVNRLKKLKTLSLILGGRKNIDEIEGNAIELLSIVLVRGFEQLKNPSRFQKLKHLAIRDCIRLKELCFDATLPELRTLCIENCKGLSSLTGVAHLKKLQELQVTQTEVDFDSLLGQKLPKTLKSVLFVMRTRKRDDEIKQRLLESGYEIKRIGPMVSPWL